MVGSQLEKKFCLFARHHPTEPLLQLDCIHRQSELSGAVAQECRGLILEVDLRRIVAWPFRRFFHHDEPYAAELDWSTADAHKKIDGSRATLHWYGRCWQVASKTPPAADGCIGAGDGAFHDRFWEVWRKKNSAAGRLQHLLHVRDDPEGS